jgi:hypothetical protein
MGLQAPKPKVTDRGVASKEFKAKQTMELDEKAGVYVEIGNKIKALGEDKEDMREVIVQLMEEVGVTTPTGSVVLTTPNYDIQYQKRVSNSLDKQKAIDFLAKRGLLQRVVKKVTVEEFDEVELARLHSEGAISEAEFKAMYNKRETRALVVSPVKEDDK